MDDYRLPDKEISALKRFHKTLKVKREADKVKAVYLPGSGYQVKLTAEVLDLDEQTVRQYFLDYKNQDRTKHLWIKLHYTGKESSLTNEQDKNSSTILTKIFINAVKTLFCTLRKNTRFNLCERREKVTSSS